jgi:hypothetical protein
MLADRFISNSFNNENDNSMSKENTVKPEHSNSKRRKKKALSAINQNVAMNNTSVIGNVKNSSEWKSKSNQEVHVDENNEIDLNSRISDSESSLSKTVKGRNRLSTNVQVHSILHDPHENFNSRGPNDSIKDKEARRLRVVLTEKDRQLASLHHMV